MCIRDRYKDADFVVIATPTNYDSDKNYFDTSAVEDVIKQVIKIKSKAIIVIKSTVPVGNTKYIREKLGFDNIILVLSFYANQRLYMIIFILLELLLVRIYKITKFLRQQTYLPNY